jgi:hypothetical protein
MGVCKGVGRESLKFHPGLLCPTLLYPADGPPRGRAACGRLLPLWTPHAIHLCSGHPKAILMAPQHRTAYSKLTVNQLFN